MKPFALALLAGLFGTMTSGCSSDVVWVWHDEPGYRWADLEVSGGNQAGFTRLAPSKTGLHFANTLGEESLLYNRHTMNGSGVAIGDVDGDGWADLYFARLDGPNVLYRNLGGWRFEDITEAAGVAAPDRFSTGAVLADIDGDHDLDLLVTAMGGPNAVFLNDGTGRFTEGTAEAGLAAEQGSTTMTLADIDSDGDLDLYVTTYKARSVTDIYPPHRRLFERTVIQQGDTYTVAPEFAEHYVVRIEDNKLLRLEYAEPDQLYLNDGAGRFSPVSFTDGAFLQADGTPLTDTPTNWGLTARFQDINGDGNPDLYVCNDFESPDHVWLGDGTGRFRAAPPLTLRKTSLSTMSVDFSDVDEDGHLDFFLTDMLSRHHARRQTQVGLTLPMATRIGEIENRPQAVQNMLFLNRGDGTYTETASASGIAASEWSWSGLFLDVDLDGLEDLLITTGHLYDVQDADAQQQEMRRIAMLRNPEHYRALLLDFPGLALPNIAFRNRGDQTFEDMPEGWGFGESPDVSHGLAFSDLDHDGDLDAIVNRLNDVAGVYRNEASAPRLAVRLRGQAPNTQGIGATIRVSGGPTVQTKEVISGGQYLSGSDPVYAFAVGSDALTIDVRWRSGRRSTITGALANRIYEIEEPPDTAPAETAPTRTQASTLDFEAIALGHRHQEPPFPDFDRQPLLPRQLSQLGPAAAWADLDGDGDDDLVLGAGRGGALATYLNDGTGNLRPVASPALPTETPTGDITGVVTMQQPGGGTLVLAGVSNYEGAPHDSSWVVIYAADDTGALRLRDRLPFGLESVGPLALADVDGDGDLDLFAGGRVVPGRYPEPASSRLYRNEAGHFHYDAAWSTPLARIGLTSGAAFGDMEGDGDADLLLATEWGSLRFFENDGRGEFTDQTTSSGLAAYTGWWNGVALGDFDADGQLDIVATNWGWNTKHGRDSQRPEPLRLYYGDFDSNGMLDIVEAHYEPTMRDYAPDRGLAPLSFALPYIRERTPSHHQFATAPLREIIGPRLADAPFLEAATLAHTIFFNRRQGAGPARFEAALLPMETQRAPAFAAAVSDYDGDGHDDIFLSQNFFALPMGTPRLDAGRGLWVRGEGNGRFTAAPGTATGIKVYGEGRGAALADADADGRIDLVVTQNGAETRYYRGLKAHPGLRVRLQGPPENPNGIGALVRLRYDDGRLGPARLVAAGSGYWSQSSSTPVLGRGAMRAEAVVVSWPGGGQTESAVPADTLEINVLYEQR